MSLSSSSIREGDRLVKWNNFTASYFASASHNRLDIYRIEHMVNTDGKRYRSALLQNSSKDLLAVSCAEWSQDKNKPMWIAYGCSSGTVNIMDTESKNEIIVNNSLRYRRPCTQVTWSPLVPSLLATGFDKQRTEYCALVWDIEVQCGSSDRKSGGILNELSRDATASMVWIPQSPDLIAVGTFTGWVRMYDLRTPQEATLNVMAHIPTRPRKVKGIRPDPFNEHLMATFSDSAGEPVKIWDLRKVSKSNSSPSFVIDPLAYDSNSQHNSSSAVVDVAWSPRRSSVLGVASSHSKRLPFFSVSKSLTADGAIKPIFTLQVDQCMRSLSWSNVGCKLPANLSSQMKIGDAISAMNSDVSIYPNRLLLGTSSGVCDLAVQESVPLALSAANDLVYGGGCLPVVSTLSTPTQSYDAKTSQNNASTGPCDLEESQPYIESIMKHRCLSGYAMDAVKNLQVLYLESDSMDKRRQSSEADDVSSHQQTVALSSFQQLSRVWSWIERIQDPDCFYSQSMTESAKLNLAGAGAMQIMTQTQEIDGESESSLYKTSEVQQQELGCSVFISRKRSMVRMICGWTDMSGVGDLEDISVLHDEFNPLTQLVDEALLQDGCERAAALALFHGDLQLAVSILRSMVEPEPMKPELEESYHAGLDRDSFSEVSADLNKEETEMNLVLETRACAGVEEHTPEREGEAIWGENSHMAQSGEAVKDFRDPDGELEDQLPPLSPEYLSLLSLVAMCFAGFSPTSGSSILHGNSIWSVMCRHVISQLEQYIENRPSTTYLSVSCQFLLSLTSSDAHYGSYESATRSLSQEFIEMEKLSFSRVIMDDRLSIEDRVAFASAYLSDTELIIFLSFLSERSQASGDLEGLLVTGLGPQGVKLIQKYLDMSGDIQSAALLMCQVRESGEESADISRQNWLQEYRQLLNRWKMFIERAELDVELAQWERELSSVAPTGVAATTGPAGGRNISSVGVGVTAGTAVGGQGRAVGSSTGEKKGAVTRSMYSLPPATSVPHLYLRCHYCSTSLPVDAFQKQNQAYSTLRRIKPVMTCCPHCKSPLPRCYVCLLYMGLVNPQIELKMAMRRKSSVTALGVPQSGMGESIKAKADNAMDTGGDVSKDNSNPKFDFHNVLSTGNWFMWCQSCKHGGHAHCIDSWFSEDDGSRKLCGVNGCNCRCIIVK